MNSQPTTDESTPAEQSPAPARTEELAFVSTPEPHLGVEIELQILDHETGDLAPGSVRVLKAVEEEKVEGVTAELMQSMLEIKTGICKSVDEVRDQLLPRLKRVRNIASSLGFDLAMAGTHPFHRTTTSTVFPAERYERIMDRLAWITYQRVMFGLHVHVGIPSGDLAIGAINFLVQYVPHLIALSASSPFWQGVDTGLASSRTALYRLLPHSGLPEYFANWKDFRAYFRVLRDCNTIASYKDIYWDIRPRPDLGTIEFRICDMPLTLTETLSLVALIHSLTIFALCLLQENPRMKRGDIRKHWIAVENKWLATRYGLDASVIRTPSGKRNSLRSDLAELLERLRSIAQTTGDDKYLARLQPVDKIVTGTDRQRHHHRETGNWKALAEYLAGQLLQDLEGAK